MHRNTLMLLCVLAAGCGEDDAPLPLPSGGGETTPPGPTTPPPAQTVAQSTKANVRSKRSTRMRNDFAQALDLDPAGLCLELGQYSCTDDVHRVALGESSPYSQGIYEPARETGTTAALIVERVALAACGQRADLDLAAPQTAVIFVNLPVDADGNLEDPAGREASSSVRSLYQRFLLREPREDELEGFVTLYNEIAATKSTGAARDWAVLGCFAVATSMESLFY